MPQKTQSLTVADAATNNLKQIQKWVTAMGIARREPLSELELLTYSRGVMEFPLEAIRRAAERISKSPREQYETKVPALGEFIEEVKRECRRIFSFKPCGSCHDGMVVEEKDGNRYARECQCKRDWRNGRVAA